MQASVPDLVPLTADEKDFLLSVYDRRWRLWFFVYILLVVMAMPVANRIDMGTPDANEVARWKENNHDTLYFSPFGMRVISVAFLEIPILGTAAFFLFRRVLPLKWDANSGMKEKVPYTITEKQYYAVSDQYFFDVDDPVQLHHEVDADTYNSLNEGDSYYYCRGAKSKFVFEVSGKYTIM